MEMNANVQERPDVSVEEGLSHELITRVLKLRWMGMENEARRMQLALRRADAACTMLTGGFDTD
jgi:hypothetical protein